VNYIALGSFLAILLLLEVGYFVLRNVWNSEKRHLRSRLTALSNAQDDAEATDIRRNRVLSEVPWLNRFLSNYGWTARGHRLLELAGVNYPLGFFLLLSLLLTFFGFGIGLHFAHRYWVALPVAVVFGLVPFLYLSVKKRMRMQKFQAQLPDALDLIARSLKAGHAFSGGLKMAADELGDPVGVEFQKTLNEINLGVSVPEALKNLADRIECVDLNFFVISVIIQRETGGNLAEILENIGRLIRERFKLFGRIRVLAAEGKYSALILILLPFFITLVISMVNPEYIGTLVVDPIGHVLIGLALFLMVLGIFAMSRMVKIRV
jgi:tight adherence protein B